MDSLDRVRAGFCVARNRRNGAWQRHAGRRGRRQSYGDGVPCGSRYAAEGSAVWSTRELAELAGTTVRAVRHYHEVGLLCEPRRRANGYKQYDVAHLVRALRIKRLAALGFSLPQIAELADADQHPREALRGLDTQLAHTLERLQRVRVKVHEILRQSAPTDLLPALGREDPRRGPVQRRPLPARRDEPGANPPWSAPSSTRCRPSRPAPRRPC